MLTVQELAAEIDTLQPNLKELWDEPNYEETVLSLIGEPFSALNAFKLELLMCHIVTNNRVYIKYSTQDAYAEYIDKYSLPMYTEYIKQNLHVYNKLGILDLNNKHVPQQYLIIKNVTNPKKYMNRYLKGIGAVKGSTAVHKTLEPNEMSLSIFTAWLNSSKPLNSVQAATFLNQIRSFRDAPEIREKYLDAVLTHCPKPSIQLQQEVTDWFSTSSAKYYSMNRWKLRSKIQESSLLVFPSVYDTLDSSFKPFVSNLTVAPITTSSELSSLLSTVLVLLRQNQLSEAEQIYLDNLLDYINLPEHATLLAPLKATLKSTQHTIPLLMEKL